MHEASALEFQALRAKMESESTPQMMKLLDISANSLPIIWDADFLYGPRDPSGKDTYVLCETNSVRCFLSQSRRRSKLPASHWPDRSPITDENNAKKTPHSVCFRFRRRGCDRRDSLRQSSSRPIERAYRATGGRDASRDLVAASERAL